MAGSNFRRFISRLGQDDIYTLAWALSSIGYDAWVENGRLQSPYVRLDVNVGNKVNWVETRRVPDLDGLVDYTFKVLIKKSGSCHCSDCYAHFTPGDKPWDVQPSASCELSYRRTHHPQETLVDRAKRRTRRPGRLSPRREKELLSQNT